MVAHNLVQLPAATNGTEKVKTELGSVFMFLC